MALLDEGMACAICGEPITDIDTADIFATSCFGMRDPRFRRLDDAAMHQRCIDSWEHRDAFIAYYNEACRDELCVSEDGHVVYETRKGFIDILEFCGSLLQRPFFRESKKS